MRELYSALEDTTAHRELLQQAHRYAEAYLVAADGREVYPAPAALAGLDAFREALPEEGAAAGAVLRQLHEAGAPGTVAQTGGRYFGFVNGGLLPVAHAAKWMADTWDQNTALYAMSPTAAVLEEVCEGWLAELFCLQRGTAAGFVSGSANATLCALAAARTHLLAQQGYDLAELGAAACPPVRVVTGQQAHSTVLRALDVLGFGRQNLHLVPVNDAGRLLANELPPLDGMTIVVAQAGGVNGGGFDPLDEICQAAHRAGAWVHVDGAIGLWAAASAATRHLTAGLERADSCSVDAHKALNVPYDCGVVLCQNRAALQNALRAQGAYIQYGTARDGMQYTTEMSRCARAVPLWAALKTLGRTGVQALVDSLCAHAAAFAQMLAGAGFMLPTPPSFNQFMVHCGTDALTDEVLRRVQESGECWCGGTVWQGRRVIRVSVCSWKTTEADLACSTRTFAAALREARAAQGT